MVDLGAAHGVRTVALLTDMSTPLGRTVGNALEVAESVEVLAGGGPPDVVELTLALAREMLDAAGLPTPTRPRRSTPGRDGQLAGDDPGAGRRSRRAAAGRAGDRDVRAGAGRRGGAWTRTGSASPPGGSAPAGPARRTRSARRGRRAAAKPGDPVAAGRPLLELRTDDGSTRIPAAAGAAARSARVAIGGRRAGPGRYPLRARPHRLTGDDQARTGSQRGTRGQPRRAATGSALPLPPPTFPLVWEPGDRVELRDTGEIEARAAVLHVVVARCFGMPPSSRWAGCSARTWWIR